MSIKVRITLYLCLVIFGVLTANAFNKLYFRGYFSEWHSLSNPPVSKFDVEAVEFGSYSETVIFVDKDGRRFRGTKGKCSAGFSCWDEIFEALAEPRERDFKRNIDCLNDTRFDLKVQISDAIDECIAYEDSQFGTHFLRYSRVIVSNDGTVKVWQFIPGHTPILIYAAGYLFGAALIVVSLLIEVAIRYRKRFI